MLLPCSSSMKRSVLRVVLALMLSVLAWSQDQPQPTQPTPPEGNATAQPKASGPVPVQAPQPQQFVLRDYSKPSPAFPNIFRSYAPRQVPPPDLANTPRIDQLMHDGKILLSMDDAIALALENNLDIGIARYNLNIADTDVLRAKSGANSFLGANSGIVQNTPGGGVGGLGGQVGSGTGGTTAAAGGIGAGTNGLVSSTLGLGSLISSFDPVITGTVQEDHLSSISSSAFTGVPILLQNTGTYNICLPAGFSVGHEPVGRLQQHPSDYQQPVHQLQPSH
jgi:outer membrane protein